MEARIQPWLTIHQCFEALAFYKKAFAAEETHHVEPAEGELVSRLSIAGACFWISSGGKAELPTGIPVSFVVVVPNPDFYCQSAIAAGAREIFPVREEHGWVTGKIADPFGFHWEFGYELQQG